MRTVLTHLRSVSPYSQSRHYETPKTNKELPRDYEERTWRDRLHVDEKSEVFIPPMALKNCLSEAAKYLGIQIPGKGQNKYTKHFEAGVLVMDAVRLGVKKDRVEGEWFFVPSDGKRGGGKRVMKCFPVIREWKGVATWYVLDDTITSDVFEKHLIEAGQFIGIGRFRPRNNGFYGRFTVDKFEWK